MFILIFIILAIATMFDLVKGDTDTIYYVIGSSIAILLLGILYIYKRYIFAYKIKNDKQDEYINNIEINVKKIKNSGRTDIHKKTGIRFNKGLCIKKYIIWIIKKQRNSYYLFSNMLDFWVKHIKNLETNIKKLNKNYQM